MPKTIKCKGCGKEKKHEAKGLCDACYRRKKRRDNPAIEQSGKESFWWRKPKARAKRHKDFVNRYADPDYREQVMENQREYRRKQLEQTIDRVYAEFGYDTKKTGWARTQG